MTSCLYTSNSALQISIGIHVKLNFGPYFEKIENYSVKNLITLKTSTFHSPHHFANRKNSRFHVI